MPPTLTYPGVYIQELPSGSRAITGVATAVAAFVGRAPRGPVNEPVAIGSYAQYERVFGGLWRESGLGYAVRDYYANGGSQAVIVRLPGGAASAAIDVDGDVTLTARGPGAWGNALEAEVMHAADPEATLVATQQGVAAADLFHLTVREGPRANPRAVESYTNVTLTDGPRRVDHVLAASELVRVTGFDAAPASGRPAQKHPGVTGTGNQFYASNGAGTNGNPLAATDYSGGTLAADKDGLYALLDADLFTILCLPPGDPAGDLPDGGVGRRAHVVPATSGRCCWSIRPRRPRRRRSTTGLPRAGSRPTGATPRSTSRASVARPAARRLDPRVRALGRRGRDHGPHRRRARRVEGAGGHRGRDRGRERARPSR